VRAPFTPIEAGSTQDPGRAITAASHQGIEVDTDPTKKLDARLGYQSSITCELQVTTPDKRVSERYTETAGKMVVAGPRHPQSRIFRTDNERWSR